jgi:catechol 2,3-dioxygenase-like lactoylglutathione lyase family enzyme
VISTVLPTALAVSDMERALSFYRDILGFRVVVELPPAAERERWDAYHEQVCGIPGAQIKVVYLEAPDGATNLELIEYVRPKSPPRERGGIHEPGTAIVALGLRGSEEAVERLRAAEVDVVSNPVPYTTDDGVRTKTTYFYDPDGNALCLFELLGGKD